VRGENSIRPRAYSTDQNTIFAVASGVFVLQASHGCDGITSEVPTRMALIPRVDMQRLFHGFGLTMALGIRGLRRLRVRRVPGEALTSDRDYLGG
jgi:hypothetical protein